MSYTAARRWAAWMALLLLCTPAPYSQGNPTAIKAALARNPKVVKAAWWGFQETESTKALQAAIDSGADKVVVEDLGKPWIVDKIKLASNQEVFFERGCVVLAKRGAFKGKGDCLFTATLKQNVALIGYGATFRMWKADYHTDAYTEAQSRMCLAIRSCTNVKVYGLTLAQSGGDGIYLGVSKRDVTNTNVHIKDVVCDGNNRQGISVISAEDLLIENTVLKNTSGTPPMAGIDFEPWASSQKIVNCVMRNCVAENNHGAAYVFYLTRMDGTSEPVSARIENCVSRGKHTVSAAVTTSNGGPKGTVQGLIEFVDCGFKDTGTAGVTVSDVPVNGCRVRFENRVIGDASTEPKRESPIVFEARKGWCTDDIGGVEFANCALVERLDRPLMVFQGSTGGPQVHDVTGKLTLMRDGKAREIPITDMLLDKLMPTRTRTRKQIARFDASGMHYVPAFPDAALPTQRPAPVQQRRHGEYLVYANKGDDVKLRVRHLQVGSYDGSDMEIPVLGAAGKRVATLVAPFKQDTECSFAAPETGAFSLVCDAEANCVHVDSPTHRLCLISSKTPFLLIGSEADLYFWVPGNLEEFGVRIWGWAEERVTASVFDPSGKQGWAAENIDDIAQLYVGQPRTPGKGEAWRIQLRRPTVGGFEDYRVDLRGVPSVLAYSRETLLKPVK